MDLIENLKFQLTLTHSQPYTVPRLKKALELLEEASKAWLMPGKAGIALDLERQAMRVLRNLDKAPDPLWDR
jgi:hypothetical protein